MAIQALGRLPVVFGKVEAIAGVVDRHGVLEIAFRADLKKLARKTTGTVDGKPVELIGEFVDSPSGAGLVEAKARYVAEEGA